MREKLRATCHKLFEIILHRRFVHLLILFIYLSIICSHQYRFIDIDFVLWVIMQYHTNLLFKLSSFCQMQLFLDFLFPLIYIYILYIVNISLIYVTERYSKLILYIPCSSPGISHFSKSSSLFHQRMI